MAISNGQNRDTPVSPFWSLKVTVVFTIEAKRTGESIKRYSLQTETLLRSSYELVVCSDSPTNFRYCKVVVLNKVDAEALNFY